MNLYFFTPYCSLLNMRWIWDGLWTFGVRCLVCSSTVTCVPPFSHSSSTIWYLLNVLCSFFSLADRQFLLAIRSRRFLWGSQRRGILQRISPWIFYDMWLDWYSSILLFFNLWIWGIFDAFLFVLFHQDAFAWLIVLQKLEPFDQIENGHLLRYCCGHRDLELRGDERQSALIFTSNTSIYSSKILVQIHIFFYYFKSFSFQFWFHNYPIFFYTYRNFPKIFAASSIHAI